ncbi:MAG: glycosyltransferase family 1 protein, partial [Bacteroidetes bacterium]
MHRICFINTTAFWGGGENVPLDHARRFQAQGHQVWMAARPGSPLWQRAEAAGIACWPLRLSSWSLLQPWTLLRMRHFFRRHQIDTVLCNTSHDLKATVVAARLSGIRRIAYLRGLAVPVRDSWLNRWLLGRGLSHVFANSKATRDTLRAHLGARLPETRVRVIYRGIDLAALDRRRLPQKPNNEPLVIGSAGRLTPQKGQQDLIPLAHWLQERGYAFRLRIAGTGPLAAELQTQIDAAGLSEIVELCGFVDNMPAFMDGLDVFVLPSRWEGFGYVLAEAMACQVPVVAYTLSSNPEIVADGETGLLVPYPGPEGLAAAVARLLDDPGLRARLGAQGRARVEARFQQADRIDELGRCLWDYARTEAMPR